MKTRYSNSVEGYIYKCEFEQGTFEIDHLDVLIPLVTKDKQYFVKEQNCDCGKNCVPVKILLTAEKVKK